MKKSLFFILAAGFLSMATMTSCDKVKKAVDDMQQQAAQVGQVANDALSGDAAELEAMNHYAAAGNALLRGSGLDDDYARYQKQKIPASKELKSYSVYVSEHAMKSAIESFEKAKAIQLGGDFAALEASAQKMIDVLKPFYATVQEFSKYENSKEYLVDKGELVRNKHDEFIAQFEAVLAAQNEFEKAHYDASLIHDQKHIEKLRKAGREVEASFHESAGYFKQILNLFENEEDLKNADKQAAADALAEKAKTSIETMRSNVEAKADDKSIEMSKLRRAVPDLDELLGAYRTLKASGYKTDSYNDFLKKYNHFIQFTMNMM